MASPRPPLSCFWAMDRRGGGEASSRGAPPSSPEAAVDPAAREGGIRRVGQRGCVGSGRGFSRLVWPVAIFGPPAFLCPSDHQMGRAAFFSTFSFYFFFSLKKPLSLLALSFSFSLSRLTQPPCRHPRWPRGVPGAAARRPLRRRADRRLLLLERRRGRHCRRRLLFDAGRRASIPRLVHLPIAALPQLERR